MDNVSLGNSYVLVDGHLVDRLASSFGRCSDGSPEQGNVMASTFVIAKHGSSWQVHLSLSWGSSVITVPVCPAKQQNLLCKTFFTSKADSIWKTTSISFQMEDDLDILENERRPQYFRKWKTASICCQMEDDPNWRLPHKFLANGIWPNLLSSWRSF